MIPTKNPRGSNPRASFVSEYPDIVGIPYAFTWHGSRLGAFRAYCASHVGVTSLPVNRRFDFGETTLEHEWRLHKCGVRFGFGGMIPLAISKNTRRRRDDY